MFCDLVGSTALSARLDPEDFREVVRSFQAAAADVIERRDGHIAQYLGDGLLAYFGYPEAHEDDSSRAVHAGLGIVDAIAALRLGANVQLAVRIGIHTGPVVTGEVGGGRKREQLAMGETPNIAARLQALADPGTVVLSAATNALTRELFECEPLGPRALKGVDRPMEVFRALRATAVRSRFEAREAAGLAPPVGRLAELDVLAGCFATTSGGASATVQVRGEAGIGKSRLVSGFADRLAGQAHHWILGRCSAFARTVAFHPVVDLMLRQCGCVAADPPARKLAGLTRLLEAGGVATDAAIPLLAPLLGIPPSAGYAPFVVAPQLLKRKTIEAVQLWLAGAAAIAPVVLVVEDLHWADASTLELLGQLVTRKTSDRILTVLSFRPEFRPPWAEDAATELSLAPLSGQDVAVLLEHLAGGKALPAPLVQALVAKAGGVPLFVEELVRMVLDAGQLREEDGRYLLTAPIESLAIPSSLQDSLMARLDRLGRAKELAQLIAAFGRDCRFDVLDAVAGLGEPQLRRELDELEAAQLLTREGSPPQAVYFLRHALIQDAAYNALLKATRQDLHRRIAGALEAGFPDLVEADPGQLGRHWAAALDPERAAPCFQRAGDRARDVYGNDEALDLYRTALAQVRQLLVASETGTETWFDRFALLQERIADVLMTTGTLDEARGALRLALAQLPAREPARVARLHRKIGDAWQKEHRRDDALQALDLAGAALGAAPVDDRVWREEWTAIELSRMWVHYWQADIPALIAQVERMRPFVSARGSAAQRVQFCTSVVAVALRRDRYVIAEDTLALVRELDATSESIIDLGEITSAQFNAAFALLMAGELDRAEVLLTSALGHARRTGDRAIQAVTRSYLTMVHRRRGRPELVRQWAVESLAIAAECGMADYQGLTRANLAWADWREADPAGCRSHGDAALAHWRESKGVYPFQWSARLPLAALALREGRLADALDLVRPMLEPTQQRLPEQLTGQLEAAVAAAGAELAASQPLAEALRTAQDIGLL